MTPTEVRMKKLVSLLGFVLIFIALMACSSKEAQINDSLEQVALDYVTIYLNGENVAEKETFVENHVSEGMVSHYLGAATEITEDAQRFYEPEVIGSTSYTENGIENGKVVLLSGKDYNGEVIEGIVLFMDDKFNWFYRSDDAANDIFKELRTKF